MDFVIIITIHHYCLILISHLFFNHFSPSKKNTHHCSIINFLSSQSYFFYLQRVILLQCIASNLSVHHHQFDFYWFAWICNYLKKEMKIFKFDKFSLKYFPLIQFHSNKILFYLFIYFFTYRNWNIHITKWCCYLFRIWCIIFWLH